MHVLRPKTVAESQAETTRLARRLFLSPRPQRMLFPILAFAFMESYLLVYPAVDAGRVAVGAIAIALPACIAAVATVPVAERLRGRMCNRHPPKVARNVTRRFPARQFDALIDAALG